MEIGHAIYAATIVPLPDSEQQPLTIVLSKGDVKKVVVDDNLSIN